MSTQLDTDAGPEAGLLTPLEGELACGPDLEYDPDFVVLQANVAPRGDAQYGDFVDAAAPINWSEAERDCRALLARSKDLRLLVILARCRARQAGAAGLRATLALIDAMLRQYPDTLNPVAMLDGEHDPLIVANVLSALADPDGLVADVRDIALPKSLGTALQIRDIERALAKTRSKDSISPEAAVRLISDLHDRRDGAALALAGAAAALARINAWASQQLGALAPDLNLLGRLLEPFESPDAMHAAFAEPALAHADDAHAALPADTPATEALFDGSGASPDGLPPDASPDGAPQAIASPPTRAAAAPRAPAITRWDMLENMRVARLWFETHEPSSPVSVLIKQAERMVGRRFSELHRMVPPDLLEQWDAPQE